MAALVMRCDEGEAPVPSRVVQCARCGTDCWLSLATGDRTLALAAAIGDGEINCEPCLIARAAAQDRQFEIAVTPSALNEALQALREAKDA